MSRIFPNNKIVVCKLHHIPDLEYGKFYKVIYDSWREYYYCIKNDSGKVKDYGKDNFRDPTKDELREIRLNKLLEK
ncbi:MAG: hypothetical protein SLAVMIC_00690 [uncultured marine phage]|uniref:Uncharacterized protein n=1 Tax=uncultured marine phage TaxID=707152 RepID=A0A8D9FSC3_9VIRU|nr:MAG: hypothetical protein SLAVMIC_00690 [uncultured marine phage]